jgi:hypothetical protein
MGDKAKLSVRQGPAALLFFTDTGANAKKL